MAAVSTSMQQHANCCSGFAAGCTSAHICGIVDTVGLAVSVFILILGHLLIS
jgi:hypothetical protein